MPPWTIPASLVVAFLLGGLAFLNCYRTYCARQRSLLPIRGDDVLIKEDEASGYSHRSLLTEVAAASHCVKLVVTHDSLVVDLALPFALIAKQVDMVHRIALSAIEAVRTQRLAFGIEYIITYRAEDGRSRQLSVFPESPDRFRKILRSHHLTEL